MTDPTTTCECSTPGCLCRVHDVPRSTTAVNADRDRLTETLREALANEHRERFGKRPGPVIDWYADALAPVVDTIANQREAANLLRLADAWDENANAWYYEHRHTHDNGISYVGGFEDGWTEAAALLRARAAALTGQSTARSDQPPPPTSAVTTPEGAT